LQNEVVNLSCHSNFAMKLKDKVAVVTGAARGIGRASAMLFAQQGAKITVADTRPEAGQEAVNLIERSGGQACFSLTDVADEAQVRIMIESTIERWGRIDVLFNNAGIVVVKLLEEMTEPEWDRVMAVNLKSIFLGVKYAVPYMRRQGGGVVLNTASISSFVGQLRTPAYVASKGAVMLLTKSLALDYGCDNIRVNCLCPGITDTPMLREHLASRGNTDAAIRERVDRVPLGRMLTPEDIARAALYLVSDDSDGITGIAHVVDGGLLSGAEYSASVNR
jgi:NAD(P)-dependent dehydrogenase (short-subunit alcohol dehydrogenase family)